MKKAEEIFNIKAEYNKWLKELTNDEKELILEMINEAFRQPAVSGSISSMQETMDSFFQEIEEEIKAEPNNMKLIGARWAYRIAMEQFNNRFQKYYP